LPRANPCATPHTITTTATTTHAQAVQQTVSPNTPTAAASRSKQNLRAKLGGRASKLGVAPRGGSEAAFAAAPEHRVDAVSQVIYPPSLPQPLTHPRSGHSPAPVS